MHRTAQKLTLALLLAAAPAALHAQKAQRTTKASSMSRAVATMQATNGLRGSRDFVDFRPIRVGATQNGALDANDMEVEGSYVEAWSIELRAGQTVIVTMRSSDFDAYLAVGSLNDPSGSAENDDFEDGSTDSRVRFRADETGTYTIIAASFTELATGAYSLQVQDAGGSGGGDDLIGVLGGSSISYGQTIEGALSASDRVLASDGSYYDDYSFDGRAGDVLIITMRSDDFDTYLHLLDASGEVVAANDDDDASVNSLILITLPRSGRFTIRANSLSEGQEGAYTLSLRKR